MTKEPILHENLADELFDIPPKPKNNALNWWKFFLFFGVYFSITVVLGFGVGILIGIYGEITNRDVEILITEITNHPLITYLDYIGLVVVLLIFKSVRQFISSLFTWKPLKDFRTYLYIAGGFIIIYYSQYLFMDLLQWELVSQQPEVETYFYKRTIDYVLLFISLAIITPIQEELMFRGVLQKFLGEKWRVWLGIVLSSLIFGVLHPGYIFSGITMGFVFGIVYHRTHSLIPAILLHAIWNGYIIIGEWWYWNAYIG